MSDAEALMAAIAADPKSDLPRLVYADYLEENGDPDRAEFIRLQCELHRDPDSLSPDEYFDLRAREQALRTEHEQAWLAPLRALGASSNMHGYFVRGFVGHLVMDAATFIKNGAELWRHSPVEQLILNKVRGHADAVAALDFLGRPARLYLSGEGATSTELRTVLESEHLRSLRGLSLSDAKLKLADVEALVFKAADLTSFSADCWKSSRAAFIELVRRLPPVEQFTLDDQDRAAIDLAAVLETLDPTRLTFLCTDGVRPTAAAMRVLASRPAFARLTQIWLRASEFDGAALEALAAATHLQSVSELDFDDGEIGDDGLAALASWSGLRSVRSLGLRNCRIGPSGIAALAASPHLSRVEKLNLDTNAVGDAGLAAIASCPAFASLRELSLCENGITAEGTLALAAVTGWEGLRGLDLTDNPVGEEAALRLADAPHVRQNRFLMLSGCGVTAEGERALLRSLPNLRYFSSGVSAIWHNEDFRAFRRRVLAESEA